VPRAPRLLVTSVTVVALLAPAPWAVASDQPTPATESAPAASPAPTSDAPATGGPVALDAPTVDPLDLAALPVEAVEVTDTDRALASTRNEVTVLVTTPDGPQVHKLRTDSRADQEELAEHLDAQPGVVAAPTVTLRRLELSVPAPDPLVPEQWNLPMVGLPDAWRTSQGAGVIVAVVDSGVDANHPDLTDRVRGRLDLTPGPDPLPEQTDHGTRVASLIAGNANGSGMTGVAPQAQILAVDALDATGIGDSATVAQGIVQAVDAGARVINLSLGGPDPDPVLDSACAYAFSRGVVLVAAGGNSYNAGNRVQYPAASPNVIAVASVDATGTPSAFSNTGPHIDLAAPGQEVLAAAPLGGFDRQSGTSFAAPHVAGTIALAASANPALSAAQLASVAQLTAQDDVSGNGRDEQLGYGVVRADRAVAAAVTLQAAALPANARLRLRAFDALPEPARRQRVTTLRVVVQARFPDGQWRPDPLPALVRFEFKANGARKYRPVADVASAADGSASLQVLPTRSGAWRAKVRQANGSWSASKADRVRVRR
jgi:subtilisin family serine protease